MARIGHIRAQKIREGTPDETTHLMGEIVTYDVWLEIGLRPMDSRQSDKAPTHEVTAKGKHGRYVTIGSAWQKDIKHGDSAGRSMFSIQIDGPGLPEMRLAAFPAAVPQGFPAAPYWVIQTDRARGANAETEGQEQAA